MIGPKEMALASQVGKEAVTHLPEFMPQLAELIQDGAQVVHGLEEAGPHVFFDLIRQEGSQLSQEASAGIIDFAGRAYRGLNNFLDGLWTPKGMVAWNLATGAIDTFWNHIKEKRPLTRRTFLEWLARSGIEAGQLAVGLGPKSFIHNQMIGETLPEQIIEGALNIYSFSAALPNPLTYWLTEKLVSGGQRATPHLVNIGTFALRAGSGILNYTLETIGKAQGFFSRMEEQLVSAVTEGERGMGGGGRAERITPEQIEEMFGQGPQRGKRG